MNYPVPDTDTCLKMIRDMSMMEHIVEHSQTVCRVALFLADDLCGTAGNEVLSPNRELIRSGALLHDITKTRSFKTRENHATTGGEYVTGKGYFQVGEIVRQHVRLDSYEEPIAIGEAAVVNYADKRVLHDKVVSLKTRMTYIMKRYARNKKDLKLLNDLWEKTLILEKALFSILSFYPDELPLKMNR